MEQPFCLGYDVVEELEFNVVIRVWWGDLSKIRVILVKGTLC